MRKILVFFLVFVGIQSGVIAQTPSAATSTVSVSPAVIPVNGTATITVQLREANGTIITSGTTSAAITFVTPSTGTIGTITNNNNGTYSATFTASTTTGLVTITPRLNGISFTNTAIVGVGTILRGAVGSFTESGTFSTGTTGLTLGLGLLTRYLIVGGGGGGGHTAGGGGGAGGFLTGVTSLLPAAFNITVGTGGAGGTRSPLTNGGNGGNSVFNGLTAIGGGGGGGIGVAGATGGSGGGGGRAASGGSGTSGQGFGGTASSSAGTIPGPDIIGGAGGGASAAASGRHGGDGISSNITGSPVHYAGGGGAGVGSSIATVGAGGAGGGGNGSRGTTAGNDGDVNTGGGGGGGGAISGDGGSGGKGGSGIVILQFTDAATATGGNITTFTGNGTNGTNLISYKVHSFTTTGTSSFLLSAIDYSQLSTTISSVISGTGALNFNSPGRLIFTGANTYSGATTINNGTIQIGDGGTTGSISTGNVINNSIFSINKSNAVSISNMITGSGSFQQIGSGTTTLTANNNYTGTTQVSGGTLLINGNHSAATGNVIVASGAKLGGLGTVGGLITVQNGGELTPGTSPGILNAANGIQFSTGATFNWELTANSDNAGSRATSYDGVNITGGTLTIETGVTSNLNFASGVNFTDAFWKTDHQWLVFDNANPTTLNSSEIFDQITYTRDAGNRLLTSQTGLAGAKFFWSVVGNDIYLNYESGYPSAVNSQIFTDRSTIPVSSGVIANLTIQLKDGNDNNLTYSGGTLTIAASAGTISNITNNNDGTYTAVFNPGSSPIGTITITPSINGIAFSNTVQLDIVNEISLPSSPDGLETKDNFSTGTSGITFNLGLGAEYLIIGGGGAGGSLGGGGGAGEFIEGSQVVFNGIANTIFVGNGGQTNSANGIDSRFNSIVARGGGGGGNIGNRGKSGGSGGGGSRNTDGGIDGLGNLGGVSVKSIGFGNSGGQSRGYAGQELKGGGGGGAGAAGENAPTGNNRSGNGGTGKQSSISGVAMFYAAGGGGGAGSSIGAAGLGGQGGGGNGGRGATSPGSDATPNTGSGGGGGGSTNGSGAAGGKGGSGLVLVRYYGTNDLANGGTESDITLNGKPYRLHTFSNVGSNSLTFNFSNFNFNTYVATLSGNITGTGSLTFNSSGRLKITGNNTYSGTTIISGGTLQIGDGGTTGSLGTGAVVNNGTIAFSKTNTLAFSNNISGTGGIDKLSSGAVTLSGTLSYTGATNISEGSFRTNTSLTSSSGVNVASGATLSGTGALPTTTVSGIHAPGNSPGIQTVAGNLTYNTGSTLQWELIANDETAADRGTDFDGINMTAGTLTIGTGVNASLIFNGTGSAVDFTDAFWKMDHKWLVFDNVSAPTLSSSTNIFDNITVSADKNGATLASILVNARFFWTKEGDDIYLNYDSRTPELTTSVTSLASTSTCVGTASTAQTFTVSGQYLTGNITITSPTGFDVSLDGTTYASTRTLTPTSGSVSTTTIHVRLTGATAGTPSGSISIATVGAATKTVTVSGTIYRLPAITAHPSTTSQSICEDGTATPLSVTATGDGLSYQWYSNTTNTTTGGMLISGATNSSYTPLTTTAGTLYYYCIVSGECSSSVTSTVSGAVTVNKSVGGSISGSNTVCTGTNSTTLTLTGYTGTIQWQSSSDNVTYANINAATAATYTATNLTTNTYYRAVVTNGSCTAANSTVASITIQSASVGGAVSGGTTVCTGTNSATLNLSGYSGTIVKWQSSPVVDFSANVTDISHTSGSYTVSDLTATTYYRAVVQNGVCAPVNSAAAGIVVSSASVAGTISANNNTVCSGTNSVLLNITGNTGSVQWQSSSDGTNFTDIAGATSTSYTASNLPATTSFRAKVTNGACSSVNTSSLTVTVSAKPTASITYYSPFFCPIGTASVSLTGQTGGSFSSTTGLSLNSTTGQIDLAQSTPGTYTVTYSFSNASGCSNSVTTSVVVNSAPTNPVLTAGAASTTICSGESVGLTASAQTTGAISNYQWYKGGVLINGVFGSTYSANETGSYTIQAVDANGCVSASSLAVSITVNPNPQAAITQGSLLTFSNCNSTSGNVELTASTGTSYQWYTKTSGTLTSIDGATASTYTTSTVGDYVVKVTTANGCVSTSAVTKVVAPPSVNFSKNTICAGEIAILNAGYTLGANESFRWEYSAAGANSWAAASGTNNTNSYSANVAGDYQLVIFNSTTNAIISTSCPVNVAVNPLPVITSISPNATICAGQDATLNVATSTANVTYQWYANNVPLSGKTTANYNASTAGSYTVKLTDANGCVQTSTAAVVSVTALPDAPSSATAASICGTGNATVSFALPSNAVYNWYTSATGGTKLNTAAAAAYTATALSSTTTFYAATVSSGCESITRTAVTATVNPLPTATISYVGSPYCPVGTAAVTRTGQAGGTYTSTTGLILNANTGDIDLLNSTPGTYTVTYSFSDAKCSNTTTATITIGQPVSAPTITTSGSTDICDGSSVVLTSSTASAYQWYLNGTAIQTNATSQTFTATQAGSYTVKISSASCTNVESGATIVTIKAKPTITTLPNVVICEGSTASLSASGATSYSWSPSTGLSDATIANPIASPSTTTTYIVTGTGSNGCANSETTIVTVNPLPTVAAITGSATCVVGATVQLSNATAGGGWSTSNPNIASVSSSGVVTGVAAGSVVISYTVTNANGCSKSSTINVTVSSSPTIVVTGILNAFAACLGTTSAVQQFSVEGSALTASVAITAPSGFEISSDNVTYSQSLTLNATNGSLHPTSIDVRLTGLASGSFSGTIDISSTGAQTQSVSVTGTVSVNPSTSAAGTDLQAILNGAKTLAANNPSTGTGVWSIVSGPNTNSSQFSSTSSNTSTFTASSKGNYVLRWTISNGVCSASTDDVNVRVVDDIWKGTASADFNDPANWESGRVPSGSGLDIILDPATTRNIELSGDLTIGSLDFNGANVKVILGNHDLTVGSISGASSTSYIQTNGDGILKLTIPNGVSVLFPVGTSSYSPVTITNNTGISDAFTVSVSDGVYTNGGTSGTLTYANPRVDLTWKIGNTSGNTGSGTIDLVFGWDASKEVGTPANPYLFKHDGTTWIKQMSIPSFDPNANTLSYNGFTGTFSSFSIAENNAALPVTWAGFSGRVFNNEVLLEWKTVSEQNTKDFVVEHSVDGIRWDAIGTVKAAGESRSLRTYNFTHTRPSLMNYYRLLQRDKDGRSAYSNVITLKHINGFYMLKILGNPVKGKELLISLSRADDVMISTSLGQIIYQKQLKSGTHRISLEGKAGGVYIIRSSSGPMQFILE